MERATTILFAPCCVEGKVDILSIRGLLDVLAMNLQTYPEIHVKSPLFIVNKPDAYDNNKIERQVLLWQSSYQEEELLSLLEQFGDEINAVLIPIVKNVGKSNLKQSLQLRLLRQPGNFEIYQEYWEGTLVEICEGLSTAASNIVTNLGYTSRGCEKWPVTRNEQILRLFLKGVTYAGYFQTGIEQGNFEMVINCLLNSFQREPSLDLAAYRLAGFLEYLIYNPTLPMQCYRAGFKILKKIERMAAIPAAVHILIAEIYASIKNLAKVQDNLQRGFNKNPANGEIVAALGNYYEEKKMWTKAKEIYEGYLRLCKTVPSYLVLHNLGAIYAEEGHLEKSVELWCQALKVRPSYSSAYGNLMNAYFETNQHSKMWVVFEEGLKHAPIAWHSYEHVIRNLNKIDDFSCGLETLKQYIIENPEDRAGYFHLALSHQYLNNRKKALRVLEDGIHNGKGEQFLDAITREILMLKIEHFEEKFDRAFENVRKGKAKSSIPFFQECNKCAASFWPTWFLLGKAHQYLHQYPQALEAFEKAHKLAPEHSDIVNELGIVATLMEKNDYAQKCFAQAVSLAPLRTEYLSNLALSLIKDGNIDKAKQITYRALAIQPKDHLAHNILSLLENTLRFNKDGLFLIPKKKNRRKKSKDRKNSETDQN